MLRFDSIRFAYDDTPVLQDVSFVADAGAITCLVGPSGCGKSTLLRLAAGLLKVQHGEISIDGRVVASPDTHLPPEQRSVGLVFQEGALFPHLSVLDNVRFGARGDEHASRIDELLSLTHLDSFADRFPHELSGGQRQRVALARALAPAPRVLLFDEPYANLDQALRWQLRDEARRIVSDLDTVAVFVTHDHEDMTALADAVICLHEGAIVQAGSPRELFDRPEHVSVAKLFGQAQHIVGRSVGDTVETPFGVWPAACLAAPVAASEQLDLIVRPDGLTLEAAENGCVVTELRVAGADDLIGVRGADGSETHVRLSRPHSIQSGMRVSVAPIAGRVFPQIVANKNHSQ